MKADKLLYELRLDRCDVSQIKRLFKIKRLSHRTRRYETGTGFIMKILTGFDNFKISGNRETKSLMSVNLVLKSFNKTLQIFVCPTK